MLNRVWRQGSLPTLLMGMLNDTAIMERFPKKLKIELPYDFAIPHLSIYPEENIIQKLYMHPNIHCSTVCNQQGIEAA